MAPGLGGSPAGEEMSPAEDIEIGVDGMTPGLDEASADRKMAAAIEEAASDARDIPPGLDGEVRFEPQSTFEPDLALVDDVPVENDVTLESEPAFEIKPPFGDEATLANGATFGNEAAFEDGTALENEPPFGNEATLGADAKFGEEVPLGNEVAFGDEVAFGNDAVFEIGEELVAAVASDVVENPALFTAAEQQLNKIEAPAVRAGDQQVVGEVTEPPVGELSGREVDEAEEDPAATVSLSINELPEETLLGELEDDAAPVAGVVVPMTRNPIRGDMPPAIDEQALSGLDRLLRLAAARGASTLYLASSSRPAVRVDGDIHTLDGAPELGPNDVESLLLSLMPERNAEALRTGGATEWICEVPDVGRVRCTSFRDHRGPGGVFRMMPPRSVTSEQLGFSRDIQALASEPEGLVLVAGPRLSGKRTLMAALVDSMNRARRDHIITVESEISVVHQRQGSFVSQREVRGGSEEMVKAARAALREDPDVLVLEEIRTPALVELALDAAGSGQLVLGGFPAHNATAAVDRIIDLYPPEHRRHVQVSLAQTLRGVLAQVLLRKSTGGRVAARELLLNTPAVSSLLAEGKTSQLPLAIEGGRRQGMVPLNDALVGFVQSGAVDVREAYRHSSDRQGFLAALIRQGIDVSAIERQA